MKRRIIFLIALVVIVGGGLGWLAKANPDVLARFGWAPSPSTSSIFASGFIEATDVAITPEISGRIVDIVVAEGDEVKAGTPLVKLDDTLLQAQLREAEVALKLAQAGLEQTAVSHEQAIISLEQAIVFRYGAMKVWGDALDLQHTPLELEARIIAAEGEIELLELSLYRAGKEDPTWGKWDERGAIIRLETAKKALQNLLDIKNNPQEINALVDETHAAYQNAAKAVEVAEKAVEVAEKAVLTAERQIEQAGAAIETVKVRLSKLTLYSPISGVVAEQYAEAGEMAQPGVAILTVTELDEVTLTAYVPESQIGRVKLGQAALVSVDSYPGENFRGRVVYISPRALFTPKNIQLKEDREKMVFAIDIKLANPSGKLKPGMPADSEMSLP